MNDSPEPVQQTWRTRRFTEKSFTPISLLKSVLTPTLISLFVVSQIVFRIGNYSRLIYKQRKLEGTGLIGDWKLV